ncbi:MAG TPA: hypothetical protein VMH61_03230, partial [Candidatus Acidoferrales bacterium]|nr:hypothetical protein [Candidatus Acidoferrales bacterium]
EACPQPAAVLRAIRATGASAGLAIKPGTSYAAAAPLLPELDQLLVMTVEPGFGGQEFMPAMLEKVRAAAADRDRLGLAFAIEVDGGIHHDTIGAARAAGADVFVAGHAIFHAPQPIRALEALRTAVGA